MRLGVRKTIALETQDEVEAAQKALNLIDTPELGLAGTFKGEIAAFIHWKVDRNEYSRFTAPQRTKVLEKFMRWAEGQMLGAIQIKPRHIQEFYAAERKVVKESTIQSYITSGLGPFFRWLREERKVISHNPLEGVKMARLDLESSIRDRFCSREVRDLLLNSWKKIPEEIMDSKRALWLGFVLHAGFEAGLRKNEIIEARPKWFDLDGRVLRVSDTPTFRPKDREKRAIPLSDSFVDFLKEYPLDGEWCIAPKATRGKSDYRYDFEAPFKKYLQWLKTTEGKDLSWITPHVMRHTFASLLASAGVSLYKIAKWLGDTHRTAEKHYAHLQASDDEINQLRPKPEKLDAAK